MLNKVLIGLGLVCFLHIYILSQLIFFPYPELFVYPYLTNHGLLPYKEIFDQHFPGLFFLPLNFERLGLTNEYIARYWQYGLVIISQVSLFFISRRIFKNDFKALIVNFLYLLWQPFFQGWVLWINNILTILYLVAFLLIIEIPVKNAQKRLFLLGLVLGLAIVFKQVALPLAGLIGIYLLYTFRISKNIFSFIAGLLLPIFSIISCFASMINFKNIVF
jgi:dolichyl-phosphate-mannose--protein O-mannosyl transferase